MSKVGSDDAAATPPYDRSAPTATCLELKRNKKGRTFNFAVVALELCGKWGTVLGTYPLASPF